MLFKYFSEITIVIISVKYVLCVTHLCLVFILSILGYFLSDELKLFILFYVFNVTCTFIYINRHVRHTFIHICLHLLYYHICVELYFMFSMSSVLLYFVFLFNIKHIFYIYLFIFLYSYILCEKNSFFSYICTFYKLICPVYLK